MITGERSELPPVWLVFATSEKYRYKDFVAIATNAQRLFALQPENDETSERAPLRGAMAAQKARLGVESGAYGGMQTFAQGHLVVVTSG